MATPAQALAMLQASPKTFLKNYYVQVERAMHQMGPTAYWFGATGAMGLNNLPIYDRTPRKNKVLGSLYMHNSKNFRFSTNPLALLGNGSVQLQAWHVDVQSAAAVQLNDIPALAVTRAGGPMVMVTTLLNGCSFVCEPLQHSVLMAHIQPIGTNAIQLEADIIANGALHGGAGGPLTVFGGGIRYNAVQDDVTVIGVRKGTRWRLYFQAHPAAQRTISDADKFFDN